jgi:hypothetical protein
MTDDIKAWEVSWIDGDEFPVIRRRILRKALVAALKAIESNNVSP